MKQELKTQYLTLKLKIGQLLARLNETEGAIKRLKVDLEQANNELVEKTRQLAEATAKAKEYEKSFKKSDKIGKLVVSTDNTEASKAELKKKLDSYIVIIDHCIEQLRKP
jgi:chromosome segregation ATPase